MPLYEYRCSVCEHQFEVIQSFSAKPIRKCEKCGGKVQKLVSRTAFLLKGGGWYDSGYAGSADKGAAKEAKSGESAPAASDSGSKPSEPAASSKDAKAAAAPPKKPKTPSSSGSA